MKAEDRFHENTTIMLFLTKSLRKLSSEAYLETKFGRDILIKHSQCNYRKWSEEDII